MTNFCFQKYYKFLTKILFLTQRGLIFLERIQDNFRLNNSIKNDLSSRKDFRSNICVEEDLNLIKIQEILISNAATNSLKIKSYNFYNICILSNQFHILAT